MAEVFSALERVTGVPAPTRKIPLALLHFLAAGNELWARLTKKHVLLSWDIVRGMAREANRNQFSHQKSGDELGVRFRPVEETLRDEVAWYVANGWMKSAPRSVSSGSPVGAH